MVAATAPVEADVQVDEYRAYNAVADLFAYRGKEVMLSGPAGTGKTRGILELVNYEASTIPGYRCLLVRKTLASLKASVLVTFDEKVRPTLAGAQFRGETARRPPHYAYPATGAAVVIGGMDKSSKHMSAEYDRICVFEATELEEDEWEALTTRLRNQRMSYQQISGDCNPSYPEHWIMQRARAGRLMLLYSRHEDNPSVTADYLQTLDALSGVRRSRFYLGLWVAAEGAVYEDSYDATRNLRPRGEYCINTTTLLGNCGIPPSWPRYMGIDFGYTNPFVCKWYAEDGDGRLIMYRELYMTRRQVSEHCADIRKWADWKLEGGRLMPGGQHADPFPRVLYCDPSAAEAKAQLRQHLPGVHVVDANNDVKAGIDLVATRWKPALDGKPRLIYLRDSLIERDRALAERKLPTCSAEEIDGYVWDTTGGQKRGERPVKENDHGMDVDRYVVISRDLRQRVLAKGPRIW